MFWKLFHYCHVHATGKGTSLQQDQAPDDVRSAVYSQEIIGFLELLSTINVVNMYSIVFVLVQLYWFIGIRIDYIRCFFRSYRLDKSSE